MKTPLEKYLADPSHSQTELASAVGLTQGAISKMLRTGRRIFVVEGKQGSVELVEEKIVAPPDEAA